MLKAGGGINGQRLAIDGSLLSPTDTESPELGIFHTTDSGDVTFTFTEAGVQHAKSSGTVLGLNCSIDASKENANTEGEIEIILPNDQTYTIIVDSLKPNVDPSVNKEANGGKLSGEYATWTITYNPGDPNNPDDKYPNKLVDTIPEGMKFAEVTSIKVGGAEKDKTYITPTSDGQNETFNIPLGDEKKKIEITYKTKLTDSGRYNLLNKISENDANSIKYTNSVQMYNDDTENGEPATATVTPTDAQKKATTKKFVSLDSATNTVTWSIEVNVIDGTIPTELKVRDSINNKDDSYLSNISSLKVNGTPVQNDSAGIAGDGKSFEFDLATWLNNNKESINANGQYTITYTTDINDSAYGASQSDLNTKAANEATLTYKNGSGTVNQTSQAVVGAGDVANTYIKKEIISYGNKPPLDDDEKGRLFKYKITVNPNRRPVNAPGSIIVLDELQNSTLEYHIKNVEIESGVNHNGVLYYTDNSKATSTNKDTVGCKAFEVTLTGMDRKSCEIIVTVKLTDLNIFGSTDTASMTNRASVSGDVAPENSEVATHTFQQGGAHVKLLQKYDPEKQEAVWRVALNQDSNCIATGKVIVEDTLPAGLEYVSSMLDGYDPKNGNGISAEGALYDTDGFELKEKNDNGNGTTTLKYEVNIKEARRYDLMITTKVNFDIYFYSKTSNTVLKNDAKITTGEKVVEKSATLTIPKQPLADKTGEIIADSSKVEYTVGLNPLKQDIKTALDKIILTDKLGSNLVLDPNSIKVYKATVAMEKDISGENVTLGGYKYVQGEQIDSSEIITDYDFAENTLKIEMPMTSGKETYLIKYEAYATSSGDLNNDITVTGSNDAVQGQSGSKTITFDASVYGGAFKFNAPPDNLYASLRIQKVDKDGNQISAPVEFNAYTASTGGTLLGTVTITGNGILVIETAKISGLSSIWLEETAPPSGYESLSGRVEVMVSDFDKDIKIKNYKAGDTKSTDENVTVKKVDQNGNFVSGAGVTLYSDEECLTPVRGESIITSPDGIKFIGLTEGTFYYIKETTVPDGYTGSGVVRILAGTNTEITVVNVSTSATPSPTPDPKPTTPEGPNAPDGFGQDPASSGVKTVSKTVNSAKLSSGATTIIHTGQPWLPVWIMAFAGFVSLLVGLFMPLFEKKKSSFLYNLKCRRDVS